jgi:MaoC like domain
MGTVLDDSPRLGPLYIKAALGAIVRRGRELPDRTLAREDVRVDRAHLAEYARVCGFPVADALPTTYPHVLGFPLQVALMADRVFPLPLPGLVHIRNTIATHRRLDAAEALAVRVHAERFTAHPKGAQVDLVTEVDAAGERVWEGRSTYLARGASAPDATQPVPPEPVGVPDGQPAAVWQVAADVGRRYAGVSGDVNPIHLHPLAARAFGQKGAIAHGMWTKARCLAALEGELPEAYVAEVRFKLPLRIPGTAAFSYDGRAFQVWAGDKPHLEGIVTPGRAP